MDDQSRSHELFITGLKNAHAMESQALSIMRPQASRIEAYPEVKSRIEQHIRETEGQLQRLETLLEDAGHNKSVLKDAALSMAGGVAALSHAAAPDEILKNSFADYAFENFEIAAYKSLIVLATAANDDRAVSVLEQNLAEEEAMAMWLEENIEPLTLKFAALSEEGERAKS
jgi:ferritin-like metal-binding protein YciE